MFGQMNAGLLGSQEKPVSLLLSTTGAGSSNSKKKKDSAKGKFKSFLHNNTFSAIL